MKDRRVLFRLRRARISCAVAAPCPRGIVSPRPTLLQRYREANVLRRDLKLACTQSQLAAIPTTGESFSDTYSRPFDKQISCTANRDDNDNRQARYE